MAHDAFWDRFFDDSEENEDRKITLHEVEAFVPLVMFGVYTLAQLKNKWNTTAGDDAALDAMAAHVGPMSNTAKLVWLMKFKGLVSGRRHGEISLTNEEIESKLGL